jgi:hypothetical protein
VILVWIRPFNKCLWAQFKYTTTAVFLKSENEFKITYKNDTKYKGKAYNKVPIPFLKIIPKNKFFI